VLETQPLMQGAHRQVALCIWNC